MNPTPEEHDTWPAPQPGHPGGDAGGWLNDNGWEQALADGTLDAFWADRDVRTEVTQLHNLPGGPNTGEVAWHRFPHAYGPADDLPELLHRLTDDDPHAAQLALDALRDAVYHQGTVSAAGALVCPFLVRLAAQPGVHHRHQLLRLAGQLARGTGPDRDTRQGLLQPGDTAYRDARDTWGYPIRWSLDAVQQSLAADAPILLTLVDDPDPRLRCHTIYALAAAGAGQHAEQVLRERLRVEPEPAARISVILGIAEIRRQRGADETDLAWAHALWANPAQSPDLRLGGALAWLCLTDAPPPCPLLAMLGDAVTPASGRWMREVPWVDHTVGEDRFGAWLTGLLDDAPPLRSTAANVP